MNICGNEYCPNLKDAEKYRESLIKRCPDCNNDVTKEWNFCTKCGWDGLCHA